MSQGRWTPSDESFAKEAYAVLICGEKATKTYTKNELLQKLKRPEVHCDFLKLCVEYDDSPNLKDVRCGLLFVVRALGPSKVAKKAGFTRMSLYRMLSKNGNPRLKNLMGLLKALNIHFWLVDSEFIEKRERFVRPRDIEPIEVPATIRRRLSQLMN